MLPKRGGWPVSSLHFSVREIVALFSVVVAVGAGAGVFAARGSSAPKQQNANTKAAGMITSAHKKPFSLADARAVIAASQPIAPSGINVLRTVQIGGIAQWDQRPRE